MNPTDKLTDLLGSEWLEIDNPETLSILVADKLGENASDVKLDYIHAIKTLNICVLPWVCYHVFENIVDALCAIPVLPEIITAPAVENIAMAVRIIDSVKKEDFHDDIAKYIAAKAMEEDLYWLPPPLEFSNPYLMFPEHSPMYPLQQELIKHIATIEDPENYEFTESPVDIQAYKFFRVKLAGSCT